MTSKLDINTPKLRTTLIVCAAITILTLVTIQNMYGQKDTASLKYGVYGIYSEPETYERHSLLERRTIYYSYYAKPWQELNILKNGTFTFYERFEEGKAVEFRGKWKFNGGIVILYDFKNSKSRPIPKKFYINETKLCSTKTNTCYDWQEKSRQ